MMAADEGDREARMALSWVVEAGDQAVANAVANEGAERVWAAIRSGNPATRWSRRAQALDLAALRDSAAAASTRFVIPDDPEWPEQLVTLNSAAPVQGLGGVPFGLWVRGTGNLADLTRRSVAIVGARAASSYGEQVAAELAVELSERGWVVISGGAHGIDAAAHRGALAAESPTIAVLAGGPDVPYPRGNGRLFSNIVHEGALVAEQPPGAHPTRMRFLARNRLIAALAVGVVVVEAAARSGARNTISWAGRCGRPAMAVPGSVHSGLSVTPHNLIRDQEAILVTCAAEVREVIGEYGQDALPLPRGPERPLDEVDQQSLAVYEAMPATASRTTDELVASTGLTAVECLSSLSLLELAGFVRAVEAGRWRRN